jgi:hypothetical protein
MRFLNPSPFSSTSPTVSPSTTSLSSFRCASPCPIAPYLHLEPQDYLPSFLPLLFTPSPPVHVTCSEPEASNQAAEFAKETVGKQRDSFKRYGVWGDFEDPYMTLLPAYEAAQIKVRPFIQSLKGSIQIVWTRRLGLVEGGYMHRRRKTLPPKP